MPNRARKYKEKELEVFRLFGTIDKLPSGDPTRESNPTKEDVRAFFGFREPDTQTIDLEWTPDFAPEPKQQSTHPVTTILPILRVLWKMLYLLLTADAITRRSLMEYSREQVAASLNDTIKLLLTARWQKIPV